MAICALALLSPPVLAQDDWQETGVVIDYGDDRITWIWIPFTEPETTILDMLTTTKIEMVTIGFGGLGEAVCQIDDTGCPVGDCRQRMCQTSATSPFWRIMKLNGDEWTFANSGVSGIRPANGDIYALSWSGTDPELPVVTMEELAQNAGADRNAADPVPSMRTDGESASSNDPGAHWASAAGALGLIVIMAGVLVFRARLTNGRVS